MAELLIKQPKHYTVKKAILFTIKGGSKVGVCERAHSPARVRFVAFLNRALQKLTGTLQRSKKTLKSSSRGKGR